MNNTTIINTFHSDISNIAYIKTQNRQIMATIACRILKFKSVIKKPLVTNPTFFTSITLSRINSFAYINYEIHLSKYNFHQFQKDFRQDNLSFASLQLYKHNCLNLLAGNNFFRKQVIETTVKHSHSISSSGIFKSQKLV